MKPIGEAGALPQLSLLVLAIPQPSSSLTDFGELVGGSGVAPQLEELSLEDPGIPDWKAPSPIAVDEGGVSLQPSMTEEEAFIEEWLSPKAS